MIHDTISYIESSPDPVVSTEEAIEIIDSNSAGNRKKPKLKGLMDKTLRLQRELHGEKDHVINCNILKVFFHLYQKLRKMNHLKGLKVGPKGRFTLFAEFSTVLDLKSCLAEGSLKTLKSDISDFYVSAYTDLGIDMKYGNVIVEVKEDKVKDGKPPDIDRGCKLNEFTVVEVLLYDFVKILDIYLLILLRHLR